MIDRIGFHDFALAPVLANTKLRYETDESKTIVASGIIAFLKDEALPVSFYDFCPYYEISQFLYHLATIRINALSLPYLKLKGLVKPTNGISVLEPAPDTLHTPCSIRFVSDCVNGSQYYFKFRLFMPNSVKFDNVVTTQNITSCDLIFTGQFVLPVMPKLHAFDTMLLTPDGANDPETYEDYRGFLLKPERIDAP